MKRHHRDIKQGIIAVLLAACLTGAWRLGKKGFEELEERRAGTDFYEMLAESSAPSPKVPENTNGDIPNEETKASQINFTAISTTCPDIVGWIRIEDTQMDYPIVQGEDNDFYLNHLADRTPNAGGAVMLNCENDSGFGDTISILHGHHMSNGSMFTVLDEYKEESFYLRHPIIRLFTPAGDYDVAVFAAYTVNGYDFGYPTSFDNETEFLQFIRNALSASSYETDVKIEYGDRILLLSTCAYSFEGARTIVLGKIASQ